MGIVGIWMLWREIRLNHGRHFSLNPSSITEWRGNSPSTPSLLPKPYTLYQHSVTTGLYFGEFNLHSKTARIRLDLCICSSAFGVRKNLIELGSLMKAISILVDRSFLNGGTGQETFCRSYCHGMQDWIMAILELVSGNGLGLRCDCSVFVLYL